jgi:hypothetical protein
MVRLELGMKIHSDMLSTGALRLLPVWRVGARREIGPRVLSRPSTSSTGVTMAFHSEPGARTLGDEPSGNPIIPARSPEQGLEGVPKDAPKTRSARVDADGSMLDQFTSNLLRALSAWPT